MSSLLVVLCWLVIAKKCSRTRCTVPMTRNSPKNQPNTLNKKRLNSSICGKELDTDESD